VRLAGNQMNVASDEIGRALVVDSGYLEELPARSLSEEGKVGSMVSGRVE